MSGGDDIKECAPFDDDELLRMLPPEIQKQIEGADNPAERATIIVRAVQGISFKGPIPPAFMLKEYEEVLSGSAERILSMAERQSMHRQEIEKTVIKSKSISEILGVVFAGLIALAAIAGGLFLIYSGLSIEGFISILATLGSLVGVFIYGTKSERAERAAKREQRDTR